MGLTLETEERVALLQEAQELMQEAVEKVEQALRGTGLLARAQAYTLARMKIIADPNHGYLTRDEGIHDLIEDLKQEGEEGEEEPDEELVPA